MKKRSKKLFSLGVVFYWLAAGAAQAAPSVQVSGLVPHPGVVALGGLPAVSISATFDSMHGKQAHRWSGPTLLTVLDAAGITDEPGKRTHMRHVILARGSDGYTAALALGEIDAKGEGKQVIVAVRQDDAALAAPRLIVPGDASMTRSVHDLVGLEVR